MKKIPLGFYLHRKTDTIYEVIDVVNDCTGASDKIFVIYKNPVTRRKFVRELEDFLKPMTYKDVIAPRFVLQAELDQPYHLFLTTLKLSRIEYLKTCIENPLFVRNRGNLSFIYLVGDKISFARSIRLVSTKAANILWSWVQKWTDKPANSWERNVLFVKEDQNEKDNPA